MRIALNQFTATSSPQENLEEVAAGVAAAAASGARVAVFPEAAMARFGTPLDRVAEPLTGPWATAVRAIAAAHGVVVVTGMFTPAPGGRVANTLLITGPGVETSYDKIHLFDAFGYAESDTVAPGAEPVTFTVDGVTLGVATCYDVRFPELFRALATRGAVATLLPASWGAGPGKLEQWELLVRARALDSTQWIAACDQADPRSTGRTPLGSAPSGIGHSLVVSPFGDIRARLDAAPGLLLHDLDLAESEAARRAIPVLANARLQPYAI